MNSKLYCINPNTKEYEEVKTIHGINIEEILDLIRDYKMSKDLKFDKFGKLEEIKRLKEDYMILQNASDEVEEEKDKEIERLNKENEYLNKVNIELSTLNTSLRSDRDNYKSIIKEVREYIETASDNEYSYGDYEIQFEIKKELLKILDKVGSEDNGI